MYDESTISLAKPLYVMAKPAGAHCNLACRYCYYLEKSQLYPNEQHHQMSDKTLREFIRQYVEAQGRQEVLFTWHGGEPMLRGLSFYQRVVDLQQDYVRKGYKIDNCIQTNGTLMDDAWCDFLVRHGWLVGVSIDGPASMHDAYRMLRDGKPTHEKVMHGIELMKKHGVEWNAMAVVNNITAQQPLEFYHFFKQIGCEYLQFTPVVERLITASRNSVTTVTTDTAPSLFENPHLASTDPKEKANPDAEIAPFSVTPEAWGNFLCTLFDDWVKRDVGEVFVEIFDCVLANWCGVTPGICTMARDCGHAGVMEYNGDVYSCDHYVFPEYLLGNIKKQTLTEMLYGKKQEAFSHLKHDTLPRQCRECQYLFACNGECPRNRFCTTSAGEPGLNYLCEGYKKFFQHVAPYMDIMKRELMAGRPASNVMARKCAGTAQNV